MGISPPKLQKTCLGYWQRVVPNFTLIGEVLAEKTVKEQERNNETNKQTINLVSLPYSV